VLDLDLGLGLEGDPSGFFGSDSLEGDTSGFFGSDSLGKLLEFFNVCL
jgi:hypothetical protein